MTKNQKEVMALKREIKKLKRDNFLLKEKVKKMGRENRRLEVAKDVAENAEDKWLGLI